MAQPSKRHFSQFERTVDDLLTCSICHEIYKSPKALPCLHSFCLGCLEEWQTQQSLTSEIRCPACNQTTSLGDNDVNDLVGDFRIQALIDVVFSEQKTEKKSPLACDCCQNEAEDANPEYCVQCCKFFCSECITKHRAQPVLSDHHMVAIESHKPVFNQPEEIMCKIHISEAIKFLCETCPKVLCTLCIIDHDPQHTISNVSVDEDTVDECRYDLECQRDEIKKKLEHVNLKLDEEKEPVEPSTLMEEAKKQIEEKAEALVCKVQEFKEKLMVDVENTLSQTEEETKEAALTYKGILEMLLSDLEEVLDGSPENIVINHKRLVKQVSSVEPSPFDVCKVCVDFSSLSLK